MQTCPNSNRNYFCATPKNLQCVGLLQSQWKLFPWQAQVSSVCRYAPCSMESISEQDPSIPSVQICLNLNRNYFHDKPKHSQHAACRNGSLSREIISEQHQSIYSVQKCPNLNRNNFDGKPRHPSVQKCPTINVRTVVQQMGYI